MAKEVISGAEALMRSLQAEGVTTIFGYPGGSIMPVFDALYGYTRGENKVFDHILVRHEQAAAHAAQGYARVSGEVGVTLVTSGPGATNTLTGIADAMMDSTPIVVIAGQVGVGALGDNNGNPIQLGTANFTVREDGLIQVDDGREIQHMTANINRHRKSRDMCWISINIHRKCCCCPSKSTRADTTAIYFC